MTGLRHDLRCAWRALLKNPGFTAVAVATLAVGVGLNTAVFSVVNAVLLKPLPVAAPEELVHVYTSEEDTFLTHAPNAYPDFEDVRAQCRSLSKIFGYTFTTLALESGEESELVVGELATGDYFAGLGLEPALGRFFGRDEDSKDHASPVAVLSYASFQNRFGGDRGIVGQELHVNGQTLTIVGVAPEGFTGLTRGLAAEAWIPMGLSRSLTGMMGVNVGDASPGLDRLDDRKRRWMWVAGRLAPGVTFDQARSEITTLGHRLQAEYRGSNEGRELLAVPADRVRLLPGVDTALYAASFVIMGIVGLVLLIASANLANMLLARAMSRRKEIATRLSLGASRSALARQLLVESLLLALLGGAAGLLLAVAAVRLIGMVQPRLPIPIPLYLDVRPDLTVLVFTLAAATFTAVAFGMAPVLEAMRTDLARTLHEGSGSVSEGRTRRALRSALVVAQIALSLLLLICAALSVRSMLNANDIDPGFDPDGVVVLSLSPQLQGYDRAQTEELYRTLGEELRALPGVRAASTASHVPLSFEIRVERAVAAERASSPVEEWPDVDSGSVAPGYFEVMGISLVFGREFTEQDTSAAPQVAVVSEELAKRFWPGQDPIGRRLRVDGVDGEHEVVGVARQGKYRTLGEDPRPYLYRPMAQAYESSRTVLVGFGRDELAQPAAVRRVIRSLDEDLAIAGLGSLREAIGPSLLLPRFGAALFGLFGVVGLLLAAIGIYGVIAYTVSRRTHEIGIRMAMGAGQRAVLGLVVRDGLRLGALGVALGLVAAVFTTRVLRTILYGVGATDAPTFVAVSAFLIAVAVLASWLPARRAASLDPVRALRRE